MELYEVERLKREHLGDSNYVAFRVRDGKMLMVHKPIRNINHYFHHDITSWFECNINSPDFMELFLKHRLHKDAWLGDIHHWMISEFKDVENNSIFFNGKFEYCLKYNGMAYYIESSQYLRVYEPKPDDKVIWTRACNTERNSVELNSGIYYGGIFNGHQTLVPSDQELFRALGKVNKLFLWNTYVQLGVMFIPQREGTDNDIMYVQDVIDDGYQSMIQVINRDTILSTDGEYEYYPIEGSDYRRRNALSNTLLGNDNKQYVRGTHLCNYDIIDNVPTERTLSMHRVDVQPYDQRVIHTTEENFNKHFIQIDDKYYPRLFVVRTGPSTFEYDEDLAERWDFIINNDTPIVETLGYYRDKETLTWLPDTVPMKPDGVYFSPLWNSNPCDNCGQTQVSVGYQTIVVPWEHTIKIYKVCKECLHNMPILELDDKTYLTIELRGVDVVAGCFKDHFHLPDTVLTPSDNMTIVHERNDIMRRVLKQSLCGVDGTPRADIYFRSDGTAYKLCTSIQNYWFKPRPMFFGETSNHKFMGVELELMDGGVSNSSATKICKLVPEMYCKTDSSLDEGFELITEPCSLDYHLSNLKWEYVLNTANALGYTARQGSGIHVHVSKRFWGKYITSGIVKLCWFTDRYREMLRLYARRGKDEFNRWAKPYGFIVPLSDCVSNYKSMYNKYNNSSQHHYAVNLKPADTVEIRLFASTLDIKRLHSILQFTDCLTDLSLLPPKDIYWNKLFDIAERKGYTELLDDTTFTREETQL